MKGKQKVQSGLKHYIPEMKVEGKLIVRVTFLYPNLKGLSRLGVTVVALSESDSAGTTSSTSIHKKRLKTS